MPREKSRIEVKEDTLNKAVGVVLDKLESRLKTKGRFSYISSHEALGIITEEFWEYVEAVKGNDSDEILHELIDIAVGCIFGIASMKEQQGS